MGRQAIGEAGRQDRFIELQVLGLFHEEGHVQTESTLFWIRSTVKFLKTISKETGHGIMSGEASSLVMP